MNNKKVNRTYTYTHTLSHMRHERSEGEREREKESERVSLKPIKASVKLFKPQTQVLR